MTLETLAWLIWAPFGITALGILVPIGIHEWRHYKPNDWGR